MRIISFRRKNGSDAIGVMVDDTRLVDVSQRDATLPVKLRDVLAMPDGIDRLRKAAQGQQADFSFDEVSLLPVIPESNAIWALALNYKSHIEETGLTTSPDYPQIFLRTPASQVGHLQPIVAPPME
ncbi:MAG: 2-keto-4-pentenoate hydratase, partial [Burkholderiales bacterium]